MHCRSPRPSRGFTLIELLVVIAIIGILASLLLPVISRGNILAKRTQCLGHLRQYGVYLSLYLDEHGRYPPSIWMVGENTTVGTTDPIGYHFSPKTAGELPNTGIWRLNWKLRCPVDRAVSYEYNLFARTLSHDSRTPLQLDLGGEPVMGPPAAIPVAESAVVNPSDTIAYSEQVMWKMLPLGMNTTVADFPRPNRELALPASGNARFAPMVWVHRTALNQLFCDGHAESVSAKTFSLDADRTRRRWFIDNQPHRELKRLGFSVPQ